MAHRVPVLDHPAEAELFGQVLTCHAVLPVQFVAGERPLMQQQSEAMLHGLAVAEDSRGEDPDDHGDVPQSMQRLEAKLDLVLSLLGKLASERISSLPVRPLRWSHLGLRVDEGSRSDSREGDLGVLKLQPVAWLGDHIELPARVLAVQDNSDGGRHLWLRFGALTPGLEDALTRHLFRMHRRQVAEARQVANDPLPWQGRAG